MRPTRRAFLASLAALSTLGCGDGRAAAPSSSAGLTATGAPRRVLPVNSAAFDVVVDLLPRERIAAIPGPALEWSPLPGGRAAWAGFPVLAGLDGERILAIAPDLVVASTWSDRAALENARAAGIPVLELPDAATWEALVQSVALVGDAVGEPERAREVVSGLERRRAALAAADRPARRVLPYANFGAGGTTAGADTTVDLMIRLAGLVDAATEAGLRRHADLSLEQVIAIDPDLFLTASGRDGVHPGAEFLRGEEALESLRAIREDRFVVLPADLYSTSSHRLLDAAEELARAVDALFGD